MIERGLLQWFLEVRRKREEDKVTTDLERYIETLVEYLQMIEYKHQRNGADLQFKSQSISQHRVETRKAIKYSTECRWDDVFVWKNRPGQFLFSVSV